MGSFFPPYKYGVRSGLCSVTSAVFPDTWFSRPNDTVVWAVLEAGQSEIHHMLWRQWVRNQEEAKRDLVVQEGEMGKGVESSLGCRGVWETDVVERERGEGTVQFSVRM